MLKYLTLLRGINVGGKNMLAMPALRLAFSGAGFSGVSTYINSGNLILTTDLDKAALKAKAEELIFASFNLKIPVAVISAEDLCAAIAAAPAWWNGDSNAKHNAIFVLPPATTDTVLADIGAIKPDYEQIAGSNGAIFWSAPLQTFSRTRLSKIVTTALYDKVTVRNANTTLKLVELMK